MKLSDKKRVLVNGHGQAKFYFGLDPHSDELLVGIEHPDVDAVVFISSNILKSINGWMARKQPNLLPITLN